MWHLVLSIVGTFAIVATVLVLVLVFAGISKMIDRAAESLAPEGVELDSGRVMVTTRMRGFRAPGLYVGGGIRRNPGRVVLTKQRLYILQRPQRYGIIDRTGLGSFTVSNLDGKLHLQSSDPPGASGSVDYRITVRDPDAWIAALTAAGARRAA